jgi:uncharacterized protein YkwD/PKD repeat protein
MSARLRYLLAGLLILLAGTLFLLQQRPSSAVLYSGYGTVTSGPLTLEVSLVPPIAQPGEQITLTARLSNGGASAMSPEALIRLPHGVSADVFDLPPGATVDLQAGTVTWTPAVGPTQPSRELTLNLTVQTVDVAQPEQTVGFTLNDGAQERAATALIWTGIPPIISSTVARQTAAVGQPVKLTAGIVGPGPIGERWDLGDGRRLTVTGPEVAFATPGEYTVWVEATNPAGSARRAVQVSVVASPVAGFQPDDDNPGVGQVVTFRNTGGGQPPLRVTWEFGDGAVSDAVDATHSYQSPGTYQVHQIVENDAGRSEAFWTMNVGLGPVADMILMDRTKVGQPLQGEALGDDTVTQYLWDMGDGREKTGATVSHLYRLPGDYYVRLVAANEFSQTEIGRWVRVEPGTTTLYLPSVLFASAGAGETAEASPLSADYPTDLLIDSPDLELTGAISVPPLSFPAGTTPAEQLFGYLNEMRAQFNLPPLAYTYELSVSAQGHAADKARLPDDPHTGTDGTTPAERLLRSGYRGGYAGEATAWGFADARLAVEFWMNSEPHRVLLLNRNTNEVGVGFVEDYASRNIWHWTADFGVSYGAALPPVIRIQSPAPGLMVAEGDMVTYSWVWPLPLSSDQYFSVYILKNDLAVLLGTVNQPVTGSRYMLSADVSERLSGLWQETESLSNTQWFVRLEDGRGANVSDTAGRPIVVQRPLSLPDSGLATGVPGDGLPLIVTETPIASPTPAVTATPAPSTLPPPPVEPPPVETPAIIIATPQP